MPKRTKEVPEMAMDMRDMVKALAGMPETQRKTMLG